MAIQDIVNDVKTRVDSASKPYGEAFKAYVDVQKKAFNVVTDGAQTLAKTETNAAKDVFEAARSSFDKARTDGVKQIASQPTAYVPDSRERIVSAYRDTVDQLRKTGNEFGDVVSKGYQTVVNKLTGKATAKNGGAKKSTSSNAQKSTASKSGSSQAKSTSKKSTASTSKSTASKSSASTARKTASNRSNTTSKADGGSTESSTDTASS